VKQYCLTENQIDVLTVVRVF